MANVKSEFEIKSRIMLIEKKIHKIDYEINKQLELPFFSRSYEKCQFLDLEKKRHTSMLKELNWVLNE